ncbi:GyrI-like domain-containing protein [Streptomyces sp. NPDC048639]|uniref:GyrI-like domain-containing protein n=1 Tax=Streptomyces sp. NPDC048639 TaxID=3365581 RepID=UPI003723B752
MIVERPEQSYVAVRKTVTMTTIAEIADRLPEIFGWLAARGVEPAGPPFFRYRVIDMDRKLDIEAGFPVATATATAPGAEGEIFAGSLPAGRYVTVTHIGHPDRLRDVHASLLDWAARHELTWDMSETGAGEEWGCRLEIYRTDPRVQPDMNAWETEVAFRLADRVR